VAAAVVAERAFALTFEEFLRVDSCPSDCDAAWSGSLDVADASRSIVGS